MSSAQESSESEGKRAKNVLLDQAEEMMAAMSIHQENQFYVYDVTITSEVRPGKYLEFCKKGGHDYLRRGRSMAVCAILESAFLIHRDFFKTDPMHLYTDGQSLIFSTQNFFEAGEVTGRTFYALFDIQTVKKLIVPGEEVPLTQYVNLREIIVEIKMSERKTVELSGKSLLFKTANENLGKNDYLVVQLLELIIGQYATRNPLRHAVFENGKSFLVKPWEEGFTDRDCPEVGDGKRLLVGTHKSVRFIEGPQGREEGQTRNNNPAIFVDGKKAAFHIHQPLTEKVAVCVGASSLQALDRCATMDDSTRDRISRICRGVFVRTNHLQGRTKSFPIHGFSRNSARSYTFEQDGKRVTCEDYFRQKYTISLQCPNVPLVEIREKNQTNLYPMEVLEVEPYQRVKVPQQTAEQSQQTTKACAVPPLTRQNIIWRGAQALEIVNEKNLYIANNGIVVHRQPLEVSGRVLPPLGIQYKTGVSAVVNAKWKLGAFIQPASFKVWAMYGIMPATGGKMQFEHKDLVKFGETLYAEAKKKGMDVGPPSECQMLQEDALEKRIIHAAKQNCKFVFIVTPDNITSLHERLKLWERQLHVITQDMKMSNALKVISQNKWQTMENVVMKTNVKLGGINHSVVLNKLGANAESWMSRGRLILGIGVSHVPPSAAFDNKGMKFEPAVVGFCGNWKRNKCDFVGDFLYQSERREEMLEHGTTVVKDALARFRKAHEDRSPKEIIIYRSGIADGSFKTTLSHEIPLLRGCLNKHGAENTKLVFIVVQKEHNIRLFKAKIDPKDRPMDQNIVAGTIVDTELSHPTFKEFYLNSHITLQGLQPMRTTDNSSRMGNHFRSSSWDGSKHLRSSLWGDLQKSLKHLYVTSETMLPSYLGSARTPRYVVLHDELKMSMDEVEGLTWALAHCHQIIALPTSLPTPLYVANRYAERGRVLLKQHLAATSEGDDQSSNSSSTECQRLSHVLGFKGSRLEDYRVNA